MKILLKKKKLVRRFAIVNAGDTAFDTLKLPQDAHYISGIKGIHRNLEVVPPNLPPSSNVLFYYGLGAENDNGDAFAQALSSNTYPPNREANFTVNAGANQYIFYAYPASLGSPTFTFQTFQGGFILIGNVNITINGQVIDYILHRSLNANLASVSVTVTH